MALASYTTPCIVDYLLACTVRNSSRTALEANKFSNHLKWTIFSNKKFTSRFKSITLLQTRVKLPDLSTRSEPARSTIRSLLLLIVGARIPLATRGLPFPSSLGAKESLSPLLLIVFFTCTCTCNTLFHNTQIRKIEVQIAVGIQTQPKRCMAICCTIRN